MGGLFSSSADPAETLSPNAATTDVRDPSDLVRHRPQEYFAIEDRGDFGMFGAAICLVRAAAMGNCLLLADGAQAAATISPVKREVAAALLEGPYVIVRRITLSSRAEYFRQGPEGGDRGTCLRNLRAYCEGSDVAWSAMAPLFEGNIFVVPAVSVVTHRDQKWVLRQLSAPNESDIYIKDGDRRPFLALKESAAASPL